MENKKINYGLLITILVVVVLFIPIVSDYYKSRKITVINYDELVKKINTEKGNLVVYVGELNENTTKELRKIRDKNTNDYSYEYNIYSVEDNDDVNKLLGDDTKVAVIIEGDIQKTYNRYDYSELDKYSDIYLLGKITEGNKSYKIAESYSEYRKLVKSEEVTMAVFGRDTCSYCNLFKVVYNAVAEKYNVDIYYFNSDSYDSADYTKIINMDLTVPAKCNSYGEEFKLSDGFGTPLTVFTQDGEIIDCISGYVNRSKLIEKLTSLEMISE